MAQPTFRPYTGGIQPVQGQIEAGARIGQMTAGAFQSFGASIAEGLKEYNKNAFLNEQAAAEAESSGMELARMMSVFGDNPEYAPFVAQYAGLIDKAKKAPTMGMSQRLSLANELKAARQSLGSDLQMYEFGKQKRLEAIARGGMREGILDKQVVIGGKNMGLTLQLRVDQNIHQQLENYRAQYNEIAKQSETAVKPFDTWLLENADDIKASIAAMPNAPEDLKAAALSKLEGYFGAKKKSADVFGASLGYDAITANPKTLTGQDAGSMLQAQDASMYGYDNAAGLLGQDMQGLTPADLSTFGAVAAPASADYSIDPMYVRAMEASKAPIEAERQAPSPLKATEEARTKIQKPDTVADVRKLAEKAVAKKSEEDALLGDKKAQQIAYLKGLRKVFMNQDALTYNVSGFLNWDMVTDSILKNEGAMFPSAKVSIGGGKNTDITQANYDDLISARRDELESLGRKVADEAGLPSTISSLALGTLRAIPETVGLIRRKTLTPEEQIRGIKAIDRIINEIDSQKPEPSKEEQVKSIVNKTEQIGLSNPKLMPSFGVADAFVGRVRVTGEMSGEAKRNALRNYVASKAGFDSGSIDSVVNSLLPSTGPDIRTIDTPNGPVTVMAQPDGKWTQLTTGGAGGAKPYMTYGTRTPSGGIIPRVIKSANGNTQVQLSGDFQGPESAFVKFNEGIGLYMDGIDAAKRLKEITGITGKSMPWNADLQAEAAGLVARIKAAVRVEAVGTGAISNYEQQLLDEVILNPTKFFSLDSANRARIDGILNKLSSHIVNQGNIWGVDVKVDTLGSNESTESNLRKAYGTRL